MLRIFSLFLLTLSISCSAAAPFDWSAVLAIPPVNPAIKGHQILHFNSRDKAYWQNEEASLFVKEYLSEALPMESDAEVLKYGSDQVKIPGLFLELGVCTGKTINFLAALNPHQKLYGFDSFEGLPEDWIRGDILISAGTFGFKNPNILPPVLHNVVLIQGLFEDTLPDFVKAHEGPIAFLHFDSDLYSSAATAFRILKPKIVPGTILVFDELYNYPGSELHEFKALQEFLAETNLRVRYLAYNVNHEQVAVEILSPDL